MSLVRKSERNSTCTNLRAKNYTDEFRGCSVCQWTQNGIVCGYKNISLVNWKDRKRFDDLNDYQFIVMTVPYGEARMFSIRFLTQSQYIANTVTVMYATNLTLKNSTKIYLCVSNNYDSTTRVYGHKIKKRFLIMEKFSFSYWGMNKISKYTSGLMQ